MQVNGHFAADLDPLGLYQRELPTVMDPKLYGFSETDMDRECAFALGTQFEALLCLMRNRWRAAHAWLLHECARRAAACWRMVVSTVQTTWMNGCHIPVLSLVLPMLQVLRGHLEHVRLPQREQASPHAARHCQSDEDGILRQDWV